MKNAGDLVMILFGIAIITLIVLGIGYLFETGHYYLATLSIMVCLGGSR